LDIFHGAMINDFASVSRAALLVFPVSNVSEQKNCLCEIFSECTIAPRTLGAWGLTERGSVGSPIRKESVEAG